MKKNLASFIALGGGFLLTLALVIVSEILAR